MILSFKDRFKVAEYLREYYLTEESKLYPYYVYILYDEDVPFYVGISQRHNRVYSHETSIFETNAPEKTNFIKQNKIKKMHSMGKTVSYKVIGWFRNHQEVYHAERSLILFYGRLLDKTGSLTNMSAGGGGRLGLTTTDKQKEAASKANRGPKKPETLARLSESIKRAYSNRDGSFKGRKHTEETKAKMSAARKSPTHAQNNMKGESHFNYGKKRPQETVDKIKETLSQLDLSYTEERKQHLRDYWSKQPILTCEHCGKQMTMKAAFVKYHGENCKHNPNKRETEPE